ncbi:MAG: PKD domain-containing protein [Solirubrobacterales bacterium]|nr:PKD domain-containing protein [Solirubrobacterales bacterium]
MPRLTPTTRPAGAAAFVALVLACSLLLAGSLARAPTARALILQPQTIDGPSATIGELGGVAVSADGTGGLVYLKEVGGVPHVFAARYAQGHWLAPTRVDSDNPYAASYPRVAAADNGWLVVVWVTQVAAGQDALYGSTLGPGAESFAPAEIVDANVGNGQGASPSLALASNGEGLVAYRAVIDNFSDYSQLGENTAPVLRPGDVLADIRVARYNGQLWGSPQRVDREPQLSTRAPSEANAPQAGVGRRGQAVVAWQESETTGTARIWARRVFHSSLGLALQASPVSLGGDPLGADADAFALSVSELGGATVVSHIAPEPGAPPTRARLFANTLPVSTAPGASQFSGPVPFAPGAREVGPPSVSVDDQGNFRVALTTAGQAEVWRGSESATATPETALGPTPSVAGAPVPTVLAPEGGAVSAWPASAGPLPGVAVREDYPSGEAQTGLIAGRIDGTVSGLVAAGSESGESLLAFRQGPSGAPEIVGDGVSAPPPSLTVEAPNRWVRPAAARVSWTSAEDATGGVTYALLIDGRVAARRLAGLSAVPDPRLLGSGVRNVQVLANDAAGQQTLSAPAKLMVDSQPPVARVRRRGRTVTVRVSDAQSGVRASATRVAFGDGAHARGRRSAKHTYRRPGLYVITVAMRDNVGNATTAHLRVSVR